MARLSASAIHSELKQGRVLALARPKTLEGEIERFQIALERAKRNPCYERLGVASTQAAGITHLVRLEHKGKPDRTTVYQTIDNYLKQLASLNDQHPTLKAYGVRKEVIYRRRKILS